MSKNEKKPKKKRVEVSIPTERLGIAVEKKYEFRLAPLGVAKKVTVEIKSSKKKKEETK